MKEATPAKLIDALSHTLRYKGKRRVYDADQVIARDAAVALAHNVEAGGFVLPRKEGGAAPKAPNRVPSVIAPLNWNEGSDSGPRSGGFQNPERDDASGQETTAARDCWRGSVTA